VLITQASIPQFIEDNWLTSGSGKKATVQRIGQGSFDATTGSIVDMFNFDKKNSEKLILDATFGTVDTKDKVKN
jgi:phospholipase C